MRCWSENHETAELLVAYGAGRLDPAKAAVVERHLADCPTCRAAAEKQCSIWQALDAWEAEPVTADFNRRLYARMESEVSWWDRMLRPFRPLLVRQGLPIVATGCLVLMAGMLLQHPEWRVGNRTVTAPSVEAVQVENELEDMELLRDFNHTVKTEAPPANL
jgi:anti-sigma factor RsiW